MLLATEAFILSIDVPKCCLTSNKIASASSVKTLKCIGVLIAADCESIYAVC